MAVSFNRVTAIGTIVKDPELRSTPQGKDVCDVRLAINDPRCTKEKPIAATFVDVTLWEGRAVYVSNYGQKGSLLLVEGRLASESWNDRETGKNMSKLKITADSVQLIGGGQKSGSDRSNDSPPTRSEKHEQQSEAGEIPF